MFLLLAVILLGAGVAIDHADAGSRDRTGVGWVSPGSPWYVLDLWSDELAIRTGTREAEDVLNERTTEMYWAVREGDLNGMDRAAREVTRLVRDHPPQNTTRIGQSESDIRSALALHREPITDPAREALFALHRSHRSERFDREALSDEERIDRALEIREVGRRYLRRAEERMERDIINEVIAAYFTAEQKFLEARWLVNGTDTPATEPMKRRLTHAARAARHLQKSAQASFDGRTAAARGNASLARTEWAAARIPLT